MLRKPNQSGNVSLDLEKAKGVSRMESLAGIDLMTSKDKSRIEMMNRDGSINSMVLRNGIS